MPGEPLHLADVSDIHPGREVQRERRTGADTVHADPGRGDAAQPEDVGVGRPAGTHNGFAAWG
jgi:hypothetical protein